MLTWLKKILGKDNEYVRYVWYLSYGPNMNTRRFLRCVQGGRTDDRRDRYRGCRDIATPRGSRWIIIDRPLVFLGHSKRWGGGTAFLEQDKQQGAETLGQMYALTRAQFADVVAQENKMYRAHIDFETLERNGNYLINRAKPYGLCIKLGDTDHLPIYTLTSPQHTGFQKKTQPSEEYLQAMERGLDECPFRRFREGRAREYLEEKLVANM